ncbi:hypothetical protein [Nocardia sp. CC201C]|uniref:hypothetical protein n=1 Tax=Nocardia sp. CC201C TaxID=3044575 RepID=UPI0024A7E6F7|nr:hypothetical protein [Nocardia sp. CC201C]
MTSEVSGGSPPGHPYELASLSASLAEYFESLKELGIEINSACGEVEIELARGRLKLGHLVIVDGRVEVYPRAGTTLHQLGELIAQAQVAVLSGPDPSSGWRPVDGLGWSVAVYQPIEVEQPSLTDRPVCSPIRSVQIVCQPRGSERSRTFLARATRSMLSSSGDCGAV